MAEFHKTSTSSDAPSYFSISGVPTRNVPIKALGKQPRPLSTTRISAENPFFFLERGIQNIKAASFVRENCVTLQPRRYPKPCRLITSELQVKYNITRNDKDSIDRLKKQVAHTKHKSANSLHREIVQVKTKQSLTEFPYNIFLTARPTMSARPRRRVTQPTVNQQIGEFEEKLSHKINSTRSLTTAERYNIKHK